MRGGVEDGLLQILESGEHGEAALCGAPERCVETLRQRAGNEDGRIQPCNARERHIFTVGVGSMLGIIKDVLKRIFCAELTTRYSALRAGHFAVEDDARGEGVGDDALLHILARYCACNLTRFDGAGAEAVGDDAVVETRQTAGNAGGADDG